MLPWPLPQIVKKIAPAISQRIHTSQDENYQLMTYTFSKKNMPVDLGLRLLYRTRTENMLNNCQMHKIRGWIIQLVPTFNPDL